ncbi:TPA: hypothetical protein N0F65_009964 [Lagenidium giganteum]|uniref:BZIP domain-containing protein n=1 Tax=Lagenidium giganteum TaxID=4803 RepID=A0AAV2YUV5_9STRA|nr:TPA: hypothetical protein N0F65_009964 [Lagenidium giganteum]
MSHRRPMDVSANMRAMPGSTAPMSQRAYNDRNSLHRCAIALCSNPAVAESVCAMHLSRSGRAPVDMRNSPSAGNGLNGGIGGYAAPAADGLDAPDRFYRSGAHMAMQPRSNPASKKQKTGVEVDRYAMGTPSAASQGMQLSKQYGGSMALTHENLNRMVQKMNYSRPSASHGMSGCADNSYMTGQRMSTSTPSAHSESEASMDADKETNLRRERNRIAARKSRQRKLDRISNLEEEKQRLEQHRDMLVQEIRSLEKKDSGISANAVMTITDKEYAQLQAVRMQIIKGVEQAYNSGDILSTVQYFRDDSIVSGPQNSSVHLLGKDALVLDYLCTTYLFGDIRLHHSKVGSGGPRSQHFRVHWTFSGVVKYAGVSMNKEFLDLIESVKGKRVTIEGVSNFSFSGEKIVYVHRTADQAKFLSALVNLSKQ